MYKSVYVDEKYLLKGYKEDKIKTKNNKMYLWAMSVVLLEKTVIKRFSIIYKMVIKYKCGGVLRRLLWKMTYSNVYDRRWPPSYIYGSFL
jgi:hypothetical protein